MQTGRPPPLSAIDASQLASQETGANLLSNPFRVRRRVEPLSHLSFLSPDLRHAVRRRPETHRAKPLRRPRLRRAGYAVSRQRQRWSRHSHHHRRWNGHVLEPRRRRLQGRSPRARIRGAVAASHRSADRAAHRGIEAGDHASDGCGLRHRHAQHREPDGGFARHAQQRPAHAAQSARRCRGAELHSRSHRQHRGPPSAARPAFSFAAANPTTTKCSSTEYRSTIPAAFTTSA